MKIIDREMTVKETTTSKSGYGFYYQASFNSDGNITLRNYDINDKSKDEIIILGMGETRAILELFKRLQANDLSPF